MRAVLQRVTQAHVEVDGVVVGRIGLGWLCLLGVEPADTEVTAADLADRVVGLRAFSDAHGKMNLSLREVGGAVLVVSQFTLMANLSKGRRPSFEGSMEPVGAAHLVEVVKNALQACGVPVESGIFGADMKVHLVNDGPVTFVL